MPSAPIAVRPMKRRSRSSRAKARSVLGRSLCARSGAGRVSRSVVATSTNPSPPSAATSQKIARHPSDSITTLPTSGARIGETLNTSISIAMSCVASGPVCRSRTIARGITIGAPPPRPCTNRKAISQPMSGASAQPMLPATNSAMPA
jgi:hypothetical protein